MHDTIPDSLIDLAEAKGACKPALNWLRKKPRTFDELLKHDIDWVAWAVQNIGPKFTDRLTDEQVGIIVEQFSWDTVKCLRDRLTDEQVGIVVEQFPWAVEYLRDRLTNDQIADVVKQFPWIAAEYPRDRAR
jgi:hypothetical protein